MLTVVPFGKWEEEEERRHKEGPERNTMEECVRRKLEETPSFSSSLSFF